MGVKAADILFALALNFLHGTYSEHILSCNVTALYPCPGDNQICSEAKHECECLEGFVFVDKECVSSNTIHTPVDHSATTAVVTVFALVLVVFGLVLVIRRYNLVDYVRQKYFRRNNDVMYEDVMIGNDDPPLSP